MVKRERSKIEIYPMKKSPNRWAWRLLTDGKVVCKSSKTFSSKELTAKAFDNTLNIFYQDLQITYKEG